MFDDDRLHTLARLARIDLGDADERRALARSLSDVVGYVALLDELDLDGVPPTTSGMGIASNLSERARGDEEAPCVVSTTDSRGEDVDVQADALLALAPRRADRHVEVPAVLPQEEDA